MKCADCDFNNRDGVKYCTQCARPLFLFCQKCGFPSAAGDSFCGGCGVRLWALSGSAPPLLSGVSSMPSEQVLPAPSGAEITPPMESERKNVTVLFADISGFTAMSEKLDPEDVTNIMNGCLKLMADIVLRYEGYVDKFIGDCIMAIFGAPVTHENDPELAVRSGLDMLKELQAYNKNLTVTLEKPLSLHIGINSGMVIAGGVGSDRKMEYTVMGDTVNLASRLESIAGSGQVFVSEYTYNLTRNQFEFIRHEPIKVKGKKNPVSVFEAGKVKSYQDRESKSDEVVSPLIGRKREIEILSNCLERLTEGQGQAVFLISEGGVGKSRVRMEIKIFVQKEKLQFLEGTCRSFSRGTSYSVFFELFKNLFNIDSDDLAEAMKEKISQNLPLLLGLDTEALSQVTKEAIVFLGSMIGLDLGEEYDISVNQMDAQEIKVSTFRAVGWFLGKLSGKKPLVMILDDIHYADNTSVELITYLLDVLEHESIMLILLMRPVKDHASAKLPRIAKNALDDKYTELVFNKLGHSESDEMVRGLLKAENVPEEVLGLVRSRSDGNPLYIKEIIRSLVHEKLIERTKDGSGIVVGDLEQVTIPSSIQGMIVARIDGLPAKLKDTLQTAAVIGPMFALDLLKRVVKQGDDIEDNINKFVDMGLIFESKTFPEIEYSFYNLVQEAVYSCLLHQKRRELHAVVAGEIEGLHEKHPEDYYEVLAMHYEKANDLSKAYQYLYLSGIKAKRAHANEDAVNYFTKAVKASEELEAPSVPIQDVFIALSGVQELLGTFEPAIESGRRAMALMDDELRKADTLRNIGRIHEKSGLKEKALDIYNETSKLLEKHQDSVEMGLLLMNQGWVLNRMRKFDEAVEKSLRALKIFESHDMSDYIGQLYNNLAVIYEHKGYLEKALEYNQKSFDLFSSIGNKRQTANVYLSLGYLHNKRKDLEKALEYFTKSFEIMERIGNRYGAGTALMSKGRCYIDLGMYDESEGSLLHSLRIHKDLSLKKKVVANELALGKVYIEKKEGKLAEEHLDAARKVASENKYTSDLAKIAHMESKLLVHIGKDPEEKFLEAIELFKSLGRDNAAAAVEKDLKSYVGREK